MTTSLHPPVSLASESDFAGWRAWARYLLHMHCPALDISWQIRPPEDLFSAVATRTLPEAPSPLSLPRSSAKLVPAVFASGHPDRFLLLYQFLEHFRDGKTVPDSLRIQLESLTAQAEKTALQIRACLPPPLEAAPAFRRLNVPVSLLDSQAHALWQMRPQSWLIHTPGRILFCENHTLWFAPDDSRFNDADWEDAETQADIWATARRTGQTAERNIYWRGIGRLRVAPTPEKLNATPDLHGLRALAVDCAFCPLARATTRTVFGEGNPEARLLFVGEQPGDHEDLAGRPFVGPAGQLFDRALKEAGGDRRAAWVTNAVKHFRFINTPTRRLHQKPEQAHITACTPWLKAERQRLQPEVTVLLGVTGASAVLGRPVTISRERSRLFPLPLGGQGLVTVHPSFLLRLPDPTRREEEYRKFVADLKLALSALAPQLKEE